MRAFNVWLGDGSMRSALHYDGFDNVLLQVRGAKGVCAQEQSRGNGCTMLAHSFLEALSRYATPLAHHS